MLAEGVSDIITKKPWVQSSFANTGLDHQPKEHGIKEIVILAMVMNACIESTGRRFRMEIGYHLTLVKNATASHQRHHLCARNRHDERHP